MAGGVLLVLVLVAALASCISAIFGVAGGAVFFSALVWAVDAKTAIPIHTGIQLIGNTSRIIVYFKEIQWKIALFFSLLLLPGAYLGSLLFRYFNSQLMELLIGIFILLTVWLPQKNHRGERHKSFILVGFISAFLGMIVAVTGPLIASFFNREGVRKEKMVATKSFCQGITQLAKMIVFSAVLKFEFQQYTLAFVCLGLASIVGTYMGRKLIGKIQDRRYRQLNNALLIVIGLNMLFKAIYGFWV